jgi:hypothetical protein
MIQPDLFMSNDIEHYSCDAKDLSTIDFYIEPNSRQEEAMLHMSQYLQSLPKGMYMVYKTGGTHRFKDRYPDPIYPYIKNTNTGTTYSVVYTRGPYPCMGFPAKYDTEQKLRRGGGTILFSVHRLIAMTFIKNEDPQAKQFVDHLNGDKYDYRVENLEWVTGTENQLRLKRKKKQND